MQAVGAWMVVHLCVCLSIYLAIIFVCLHIAARDVPFRRVHPARGLCFRIGWTAKRAAGDRSVVIFVVRSLGRSLARSLTRCARRYHHGQLVAQRDTGHQEAH